MSKLNIFESNPGEQPALKTPEAAHRVDVVSSCVINTMRFAERIDIPQAEPIQPSAQYDFDPIDLSAEAVKPPFDPGMN